MELNKIYLGNAYELIKQVEDKSVDLIITDPPYEIEGIHGSGILNQGANRKTYNELSDSELDKGIDLSILDGFVRVMKKINIYIWCNKEQIIDYLDYFVKEKKCNWEMLIWAKKDPIPFCGTHYLKDKEYCLYFWEQGAKVYIPYERGKTVYITQRNTMDKDNLTTTRELISNCYFDTSNCAMRLGRSGNSANTGFIDLTLEKEVIGITAYVYTPTSIRLRVNGNSIKSTAQGGEVNYSKKEKTFLPYYFELEQTNVVSISGSGIYLADITFRII